MNIMQHLLILILSASLMTSVLSACAMAGAVELRAEPFDLRSVRLLDGPFKAAQEADARYIFSLDPDRLLHVFRVNANLPSSAQPLGGWEAPSCEVRGHFVGHYLSACALMYAGTGDERFRQRADYLVTELAKCQQALGGEYLSAFPESFFDRVQTGQKVWAPYYTIHKIMAGLLDAHIYCGNAQALKIACGMARYFKNRTDKLSDEQFQKMLHVEFGGMMEVSANLYAVTGDADQLALARRFDHHAVLDPLAQGQDKLAGLHANTQIPKITGVARVYELTGEQRYRAIADCFWNSVTAHHSFVVGGNSFHEHFDAPDVEATKLAPDTAESCNTYNMLKLTRHLFALDPQARYIDYYERALFNHILGSIDPDSAMTIYFLSLRPGHFKVYCTPTDSFWCCTGTGVENHARYGEAVYFHRGDTLWVNLFIASELRWDEKGVVIRQETKFPADQSTTFELQVQEPRQLRIKLRIPSWASSPSLKINGQNQPLNVEPDGFTTINRRWKDGDRIELSLPMALHLYRAVDDPDSVAILDGPIVLAGELGLADLPVSDQAGDQNQFNKLPAPPIPALPAACREPGAALAPVAGSPLTFRMKTAGTPNEVELIPLYQIHHQRYTVYWKLPAAQD